MFGAGADEDNPVCRQDFGEAGVLRQEAVTRMNGFGAGNLAGGEELGDVEVGIARGRGADAHALVGQPYVHGVGIGGGMNRHGGDAKFLAGAQHSQCNLAAVGDEDLSEQMGCRGHSMIINGSPYSTGWASSTRISLTVPARGAGIWFMVFMASMTITVWPAVTCSPTSTKGRAPGSGAR